MMKLLNLVVLVTPLMASLTAQQVERFSVLAPDPQLPHLNAFGKKIVLNGDWGAVGDPFAGYFVAGNYGGHPGAVHMYRREAHGWVLRQTIVPPLPPPLTGSYPPLGYYIAIDGTRMALGGIRDAVNNGRSTVWIYEYDGDEWVITDRIDPIEPTTSLTAFGFGLTLLGDELYISRAGEGPQVDPTQSYALPGRIERYVHGPTGWRRAELIEPVAMSQLPKFCAGRNATDGQVLGMICSDGIGLHTWELTYLRIFERLSGGWTEVGLMPNVVYPGSNEEDFGRSLDVWGDWIAVGCPIKTWDPFSPPGVPGQVYLYRRSAPGVWALYQRIQASNGWIGTASGVPVTDQFGSALDFSDDGRLVVGAPQGRNSSGERFRGGAYVFDFDGTSWVETQRLASSLVESSHSTALVFGASTAIDRKFIAVGDPLVPPNAAEPWIYHGAAYFYEDLSSIGQVTCPGVPGPFGYAARLSASGSERAHVGVVEFEGVDLAPFTTALLVAGSQPSFIPNPGGSAGNLCLAGAVRLTTGTGPTDLFGLWQGVVDLPEPGAPGAFQVTAGTTWHFQLWFRQPGNPPTSNFSSGLSILFD